MSNLNNAISSVGGIVGKCVGNTHLPRGPLPIKSVPLVAALPVVLVGGLAAYAARSLVSRLFDSPGGSMQFPNCIDPTL